MPSVFSQEGKCKSNVPANCFLEESSPDLHTHPAFLFSTRKRTFWPFHLVHCHPRSSLDWPQMVLIKILNPVLGKCPMPWMSHIRCYVLSCLVWHPPLLPRSVTIAWRWALATSCNFFGVWTILSKGGACNAHCLSLSWELWWVGTQLENNVILQRTSRRWRSAVFGQGGCWESIRFSLYYVFSLYISSSKFITNRNTMVILTQPSNPWPICF